MRGDGPVAGGFAPRSPHQGLAGSLDLRFFLYWGAVVVVLALGLGCGGAWGHAILLETSPEDGAVLPVAPADVRLRFNEPVTPIAVSVCDRSGREVAGARALTVEGAVARVVLPEHLDDGGYEITYRVTSADGHPAAGTIAFGVGVGTVLPPPSASASASAAASGSAAGPQASALAAGAVRALHFASLLAGLGGGLFLVLVAGLGAPAAVLLRARLLRLLGVAGASAIALVGLGGVVLEGMDLGALGMARPWLTGAGSTIGLAGLVAVTAVAIAAAGLGLATPRVGGAAVASVRWLVVAGALLGIVSLACTGHAATAPPRALATPLVIVHALAAAFWVGSLWPLAVGLRRLGSGDALGWLQRFSRLAVGAVAVLAASGIALSTLQLGQPGAIAATGYGQIWLAKMAVVLGLLGLAAWNRLWLTPRLALGRAGAAVVLRRSIGAELAGMALVCTLTAALTLTPPPRTLGLAAGEGSAAGQAPGYATVIGGEGLVAVLEVTPAEVGLNRVTLQVGRADGTALEAVSVVMEWVPPATGGERQTADGAVTEVRFSQPGPWEVRITVTQPEGRTGRLQAKVPIGRF